METVAYLTPEQGRQLEEATTCLRDQVLVRLHRRLGCRVNEVLGIGLEDFNLEMGMVTIVHEKTHLKLICPKCRGKLSKTSVFCQKCGDKVQKVVQKVVSNPKLRTIPIDASTVKLVQLYAGAVKLHWNGKRHLLFNFNRQRAYQIITEAAARAGLPRIHNMETGKDHRVSSHRLRDSFAVNAMKKDRGDDALIMLQQHLGHANIGTTAKYRKVAGEELQTWYAGVVEEE